MRCGACRADMDVLPRSSPDAPPGGVANRLNGAPAKLRYAWPAERLSTLSAEA